MIVDGVNKEETGKTQLPSSPDGDDSNLEKTNCSSGMTLNLRRIQFKITAVSFLIFFLYA